jgi:DNA-binding response OmpR family regulator
MPRVLILEDEPLIAMMLEGWLTEIACEPVGPAASVQAALVLIDTARIDGAILDVSLGGGDCFAVAAALRDRAVPFVFATGHGSDVIEPRFKDAPTLVKPYDFESLRQVLARLLDRDGRPARGGEPGVK